MQQILFNAYSAGNLVNRQSVIQAGEESTRNIKSYKPQKKLNYPVRLLFIGRKFVKEQTSSCEYHFQENVKKHSKYVNDTAQYYSLINAMKYATTTLQYEEKKEALEEFFELQPMSGRKKLESFLAFWHERNFRSVAAYRLHSSCDIPRSSLAEAVQMTSRGGVISPSSTQRTLILNHRQFSKLSGGTEKKE